MDEREKQTNAIQNQEQVKLIKELTCNDEGIVD